MTLTLNPYLSFRDNARAALEFYHSVLGGELALDEFSSYPGMAADDEAELIMHGQLTTDDGLVIMGSDTPSGMPFTPPAGISVSISGDDEARLQKIWDALSADGSVQMPYDTPPWGGKFGMLTDAYGIAWMVAFSPPSA